MTPEQERDVLAMQYHATFTGDAGRLVLRDLERHVFLTTEMPAAAQITPNQAVHALGQHHVIHRIRRQIEHGAAVLAGLPRAPQSVAESATVEGT